MSRGGEIVVELLRLAIVLGLTAVGFALGPWLDEALARDAAEQTRLVASVLGALIGYLVGGGLGRLAVRGVDRAEHRLERVEPSVLVAGLLGGVLAGVVGALVAAPLAFLPGRVFTLPVAVILLLAWIYVGGRLGARRGGELARFIGVRGRLEVSSPSRGGGVKLVDSSALIDGRLVDVARAGFLEGTLVVPSFVLEEVQSMADVEDPQKRRVARRGLDSLKALQEERLLPVEVPDEPVPGVRDVDAKLTELCRQRGAGLVTVDSNLGRVAEIAGVRVLDLDDLADAVRPPVLPGEQITVTVVKEGREAGQGVGYLEDGTMVVVERAADHIDREVRVDVTSIMQNPQGRMLFGNRVEETT